MSKALKFILLFITLILLIAILTFAYIRSNLTDTIAYLIKEKLEENDIKVSNIEILEPTSNRLVIKTLNITEPIAINLKNITANYNINDFVSLAKSKRIKVSFEPIDLLASPIKYNNIILNNGIIKPEAFVILGGNNQVKSQNINLKLSNISAKLDSINAALINSEIDIINFSPLQTAKKQKVSIGLISLGQPINNASFEFTLENNFLKISNLKSEWNSGILSAKPFFVNLDKPDDLTINIAAKDISIDRVIKLIDNSNVKATGSLSGEIPISISKGGFFINKAVLSSTSPGVINFSPDRINALTANKANLDILASSLTNFHYNNLSIILESTEQNKISARLSTIGINPDSKNTRPINLNINLRGDILSIIKHSLTVKNLPKEIIKNIKNNGKP